MPGPFTADEVASFKAQLDSPTFDQCAGCGAPWRLEGDGGWTRDHATGEFVGEKCRFVAWVDAEWEASLYA
jgi:hypothetical protein